jgi:3-hydroxyacyl-[acyl-carrier-protein] dehydratase
VTDWIAALPHQPPMRLLDEVVEVVRGVSATARRSTGPDDFYFQGHFPGQPIVPAVILVEMLAQTGGIAIASANEAQVPQLRVAALGPFKFPAAAAPPAVLEATARVAGQFGGVFKVEGQVMADGVLVATGSVMLAG